MAENASSGFDFSNLSAEVTELPKTTRPGRERKFRENPFVPWVRESYETKTGRAVTVPNAAVKETEYLIRQAATELGIGVRIVCSLDKEAREKAPKNRNVKVSFQGKEKRKYNGRKKNGAESTDTAASSAAQ